LHAAQRFTRIGAYDAPADHAPSRAWRGCLITRRQLGRHHRADEEQAEEDDERGELSRASDSAAEKARRQSRPGG
jgi:hypothetical protein